jgi:hypothetical protein
VHSGTNVPVVPDELLPVVLDEPVVPWPLPVLPVVLEAAP